MGSVIEAHDPGSASVASSQKPGSAAKGRMRPRIANRGRPFHSTNTSFLASEAASSS
jgi:hypothetical protein